MERGRLGQWKKKAGGIRKGKKEIGEGIFSFLHGHFKDLAELTNEEQARKGGVPKNPRSKTLMRGAESGGERMQS